ncbi:MAG: hypothetical protein WDN50_20830 [Bradyrhizobium sp.]
MKLEGGTLAAFFFCACIATPELEQVVLEEIKRVRRGRRTFLGTSTTAANQAMQQAPNRRFRMFATADSAALWFDIFNGVLLVGAFFVLAGTWGTIKTAAVKERFSDERIAANEAETKRSVADSDAAKEGTAKANERIAELSTQSEQLRKDTAEAQRGAAEAQLDLAKFRAPRILSAEQLDKLVVAMRPFAGTPVTFGVFQDPESAAFLEQISTALLSAGWVEQEWKSGGDIVWTRAPPHPIAGFTYVTGVYVQADGPSHSSDFGPIVVKLAKLLSNAGVEAKSEIGRMPENSNNAAIKILIGQKPR